MKGKLFVVSGPSGSGKSTITKIVRDKLNIPLSVSVTTRKPRVGEVNGKDYYFISKEDFEKKIKNGELFEYAEVHGNYYGTLVSTVEDALNNGKNVILEIDVQGALIAKKKYDEVILIFCKTENEEVLEERLTSRATDDSNTIKTRLHNAIKELEYEKDYDYTIVNRNLDDSVNKLIGIINGEKNG